MSERRAKGITGPNNGKKPHKRGGAIARQGRQERAQARLQDKLLRDEVAAKRRETAADVASEMNSGSV